MNSDGEAAPAGNQWSEVQHVAGVNNMSISFGVNYTLTMGFGPNRLSDDFYDHGYAPWATDSIVFYGTQTNMSTTASFLTGVV